MAEPQEDSRWVVLDAAAVTGQRRYASHGRDGTTVFVREHAPRARGKVDSGLSGLSSIER